MKKNEDAIEKVELSILNQMNESANRIADIFGGEALRVGAYSLMFINAEDNK